MKVALVHDWLNQMGGAEDVLIELKRMYPESPIYTSIYDREHMPPEMRFWDIRTSWIDRLPLIHSQHRPYLPLYPLVFEHLNLSQYDVVVSNKSGFCHGIQPGSALHVCYCLTPSRFVWNFDSYAAAEGLSPSVRLMLRPLLAALKRWELDATRRVDDFIAISTVVQKRIRRLYGRDSVVIFPPVDTARFQPAGDPDDYYLCLGRLIPYKRTDLAILACNAMGRRLKIAGAGRDRANLERIAGPRVEFLGRVPDAEVSELMARCRGFIFPGREDFGISPVQAMAAGRPVIALGGGGTLDTIIDGKTGVFFDEQTPASLVEAIQRFEKLSFDSAAIRRHAQRFDSRVFEQKFKAYVDERFARHRGK